MCLIATSYPFQHLKGRQVQLIAAEEEVAGSIRHQGSLKILHLAKVATHSWNHMKSLCLPQTDYYDIHV